MASSMELRRHISDITQCPICLDVFDRPTSLPCLHTLCLPCLQRTFVADYPGDDAACPVCRRQFRLPAAGLASLPRNFILDGLVQRRRSRSPHLAAHGTTSGDYDYLEQAGETAASGGESTADQDHLLLTCQQRLRLVVIVTFPIRFIV